MKLPRKKLIKWLLRAAGFFLIIAGIAVYLAIQRISAVTAIQNSIKRNYEMNFYGPGMTQRGRPRLLSDSMDDRIRSWFDEHFDDDIGTNQGLLYYNRFISLFAGPLRGIKIVDTNDIHGDLGEALLRFPRLKQVILEMNDDFPTEAEWTLLCSRLRLLPELEEIDIQGTMITDASIAPLAGHTKLRKISLGSEQITPGCLKTMTALPNLTNLTITESGHFTPEDQKAMSAALPTVKIEINPP